MAFVKKGLQSSLVRMRQCGEGKMDEWTARRLIREARHIAEQVCTEVLGKKPELCDAWLGEALIGATFMAEELGREIPELRTLMESGQFPWDELVPFYWSVEVLARFWPDDVSERLMRRRFELQ